MSDEVGADDDALSVPGWRRTGLVLGWGGVACVALAAAAWLVVRERGDRPGAVLAILFAIGVVAAVLAPTYLRRALSVPAVADDPVAVRARSWSGVAVGAWAVALLLGLGRFLGIDAMWLDVVRIVLAVVAVAAFAGMLVLVTRWRPALPGCGRP